MVPDNRVKHILLVDDERAIRQPLVYEMRQSGFTVSQAENGKQALQILADSVKNESPVDIIVTDIQMPNFSGLDLLEIIRKKGVTIPVLIISGHGTKEAVERIGKLGGCAGIIVKPFAPQDLLDRVRKILSQEQAASRKHVSSPVAPSPPVENASLKARIAASLKPAPSSAPKTPPPEPSTAPVQNQNELLEQRKRMAHLEGLKFVSNFSTELNSMLEDPDLVLPILPPAAQQIRETLTEEHASYEDIARVVEQDMSMSARVLQVANSPIYAGLERISNLEQAVGRLGLREVTNILQALIVQNLFKTDIRSLARMMKNLWFHSICTAYANEIAAQAMDKDDSHDYFMMGLLHDIGKLLILHLVQVGKNKGRWSGDMITEELVYPFLAMRHHDLGARLLKIWEYPTSFHEVALLHNDDRNISAHADHVVVTYYSNLVTRKLGYSMIPYDADLLSNRDLIRALNVPGDTMKRMELSVKQMAIKIEQSSFIL